MNTNVMTRVCETCNEQDASRKYGEIGWLCEDCIHSFQNISEHESDVAQDSDDIDTILDSQYDEQDWDDDITNVDLRREGFAVYDESEDDYN